MYNRVIMYLSKEGDSVELKVIDTALKKLRLVDFASDNIHPILKAAENCNSYDTVLNLLGNIKNSSECQKFVDLYHFHNSKYPDHGLAVGIGFFLMAEKGVAHEDSIDQLIEFAQQRQQEALRPQNSLCRIM